MRCPECGATLTWDDSAFCTECMRKAEERLRQKAAKEEDAKKATTPKEEA